MLTGCTPGPASPIPTSPTTSPTPSPTFAFPTFEPSRTPLPTLAPSATPDPLGQAGRLVYWGDFSNPEGWELGETAEGGTSVFDGALHLSVRQPRVLRLALSPVLDVREAVVQVEIISPICSPDDEFGLVLRANSQGEHYRAILTCGGEVRWARVLESGSFLLARVEAGAPLIPGPLVRNTLTVETRGPEYTLSVNGIRVLALRDPVLVSGRVGVFVRSGADGQTTVSFDNLAVYEITGPAPTPGAAGTPAP
jgi:hypothetical protein